MVWPEILRLRKDGHSLDIQARQWKEALQKATPDEVVRIRHAALDGDALYRKHVAAIPDRVGCHFHSQGNEDYAVVSGEGKLYWSKVEKIADEFHVHWEEPLHVQEGDSFIIPEGYAHQLKNTGQDELVILFACPDDEEGSCLR